MTNYFRAFYYLQAMKKRAFWPFDRIEKYQNKNLKKIVRYAYDKVPFYHRKYREIGVKPEDIRTVKDLNRLPSVRVCFVL